MSRILLIFILAIGGCATTGSGSFATSSSVIISTTSKEECKKVGVLHVTSDSREELKERIREKAASMGANYVQVTKLKVGSVSRKHTATGIMLLCPSVAEDTVDLEKGSVENPVKSATPDKRINADNARRRGAKSPLPSTINGDQGALP